MSMQGSMASTSCLYVFGFFRARDAARIESVSGGSSPRRAFGFLPEGESGLGAWVEHVPLEEFGPDVLQRNIENLEWLTRQARHHHEVLEGFARLAPIAPVKLGTVFLDGRRLAERLADPERRIASFLDETDGKDEWGLRVCVDDSSLAVWADRSSPELAELACRASHAEAGAAYLMSKRRDALRRDEVRRLAVALADTIADEIAVVVDRSADAPIREDRAPRPGSVILHQAVLVARAAQEPFLRDVEAITARHPEAGVAIEISGPWPPYSFCPEPSR